MTIARRFAKVAVLVTTAVVLTLASTIVTRTRLEVQDWDCPPPPTSCARPMLVLGWPFAYISDYHGISVVGRASLAGALLGEDLFHLDAFLADVAVYFVLATLLEFSLPAFRARLRRAGPTTPPP